MNTVAFLSLAIAALFGLLAWLAIWSRWADRGRWAAVGLFVLGLPLLAAASLESLSWSRPIWAMWQLNGDYRVLGAKMVKDEAIYLFVDQDGEPRSVRLPWDDRQAERLQDLFADPNNGGQAMMKFEWSWDIERPPNFYPLPQPPVMPDKLGEPEAPHLEL